MFIRKGILSSTWQQIRVESQDVVVVSINTVVGPITIFNIYNDGNHSNSLQALQDTLAADARHIGSINLDKMIWAGNFNWHRLMWDKECNSHLFTTNNLNAAQILIDLLAEFSMTMSLPKDIPTLWATHTKNLTKPDNVFCVGCIYASNPRFKSNIFQGHLFLLKSIIKPSKQLKDIFSNFSVFLLTFILASFLFFCIFYCLKVHLFASASRFDSKSRKHLPAHWLYLTIWWPDTQGAKGPGKQVYTSEKQHIASLLSAYTRWGGEPQCLCTLYLLISFVACILGSIYSQISCLHSLRSLCFRPQGLASTQSCYILLALTYILQQRNPQHHYSMHNAPQYPTPMHRPLPNCNHSWYINGTKTRHTEAQLAPDWLGQILQTPNDTA